MKSNYIFKNKKKFSEKTTTIILFGLTATS